MPITLYILPSLMEEEELRRMEIELAEAKEIISRGEQQMRDMKTQIHAVC